MHELFDLVASLVDCIDFITSALILDLADIKSNCNGLCLGIVLADPCGLVGITACVFGLASFSKC